MQDVVGKFSPGDQLIIIPKVAYVQWGHPSFNLFSPSSPSLPESPVTAFNALSQRTLPQLPRFIGSSVRGTGSLHEFIPDCTPSTIQQLESLNPIAQQIVAILHIALVDCDGNLGNLLISKEGKVVIIDMSYILPVEGLDGGVFCWAKCRALQQPLSPEILQLIQSMDENRLETLAYELLKELNENIQKLPLHRQAGESIKLEPERILTHKIALLFLKKATLKGWTLAQVADRFRQRNRNHRSGLVYEVFQEIKGLPREEAGTKKIEEICLRKALEFPVI